MAEITVSVYSYYIEKKKLQSSKFQAPSVLLQANSHHEPISFFHSYFEDLEYSSMLHPLEHVSPTPQPWEPPGLRATSPWNSLKTTRLLRCTSTLRTIKLLSPYSYLESPLSHLQSVPSCECKTLFHHLTGTEKGDNFPENGADFFLELSSDKNFEHQ